MKRESEAVLCNNYIDFCHMHKEKTVAHRANHVFNAVSVLEVLVNKRWEGQVLTRTGIKVEVVFLCVEAGLLRPPPGDEVTRSTRL